MLEIRFIFSLKWSEGSEGYSTRQIPQQSIYLEHLANNKGKQPFRWRQTDGAVSTLNDLYSQHKETREILRYVFLFMSKKAGVHVRTTIRKCISSLCCWYHFVWCTVACVQDITCIIYALVSGNPGTPRPGEGSGLEWLLPGIWWRIMPRYPGT